MMLATKVLAMCLTSFITLCLGNPMKGPNNQWRVTNYENVLSTPCENPVEPICQPHTSLGQLHVNGTLNGIVVSLAKILGRIGIVLSPDNLQSDATTSQFNRSESVAQSTIPFEFPLLLSSSMGYAEIQLLA
jgi:hypothetical protein